MLTKTLTALMGALALTAAVPASAALYTTQMGGTQASLSDCDDCFQGAFAFGTGQSINFFGTTYTGLYVGSNGYVTFGNGATSFSPSPLNTQTVAPMIAGLFTDLDSRNDSPSKVRVNSSTAGELIVTWVDMGIWPQNYAQRNTFQLVIRSDQFAVASGEGQIGFFYDTVAYTGTASAGFGDGLSAINPGEVAFASQVAANTLSQSAGRWYNLTNGAPTAPGQVPEPGSLALAGLALAGLLTARRRAA